MVREMISEDRIKEIEKLAVNNQKLLNRGIDSFANNQKIISYCLELLEERRQLMAIVNASDCDREISYGSCKCRYCKAYEEWKES